MKFITLIALISLSLACSINNFAYSVVLSQQIYEKEIPANFSKQTVLKVLGKPVGTFKQAIRDKHLCEFDNMQVISEEPKIVSYTYRKACSKAQLGIVYVFRGTVIRYNDIKNDLQIAVEEIPDYVIGFLSNNFKFFENLKNIKRQYQTERHPQSLVSNSLSKQNRKPFSNNKFRKNEAQSARLKDKFEKNPPIVFFGHSLGGWLAEVFAILFDSHAVAIDPPGFSESLKLQIVKLKEQIMKMRNQKNIGSTSNPCVITKTPLQTKNLKGQIKEAFSNFMKFFTKINKKENFDFKELNKELKRQAETLLRETDECEKIRPTVCKMKNTKLSKESFIEYKNMIKQSILNCNAKRNKIKKYLEYWETKMKNIQILIGAPNKVNKPLQQPKPVSQIYVEIDCSFLKPNISEDKKFFNIKEMVKTLEWTKHSHTIDKMLTTLIQKKNRRKVIFHNTNTSIKNYIFLHWSRVLNQLKNCGISLTNKQKTTIRLNLIDADKKLKLEGLRKELKEINKLV